MTRRCGVAQVFYVPDGAGGFLEIVDGGAGCGVCTVASLDADTAAQMLFGRAAAGGGGTTDDEGQTFEGGGESSLATAGGRDGGGNRSHGRSMMFSDGTSAGILDGCVRRTFALCRAWRCGVQ